MAKAKSTTKPAAKKAAKPVAKAAPKTTKKPAVKTTPKKPAKPAAKPVTKAKAKPAAKAPVKTKAAPKKPAAKAAPKKAAPAKKPAVKAPAKKAAAKTPAKAKVTKAKPAPKAAPKVAKAPAKAVAKKPAKPAAKPVAKAPVKAKAAPKKPVTKAAPKTSKKITYFAVNEHVVYPIQGVGEIKAIEKRLFREKQVLYYDIYFETPDMTVMVPVENAESIGLRKIVSSKEAAKALELLNKEYEQANTDWKTRNQQNLDLLKKGTISDIAQVVKTLYDRSTSKELPIQERKLFDNASKLLIDEVSLALKKSKKDSESMIFEKLEGGRKPVPEADPELDFDKDLDDDTE
ncbi:MAG: hypothetical protein IKN68_05035 [Spirochaetia bacterium]|nr:hypothetical protein [Spirochaetia bacterium]